jgi:hypothetical protein
MIKMIDKKKYKICKKNGWHTWCTPEKGCTAESIGEDINEMTVQFTCHICGAEAQGYVTWEDE